MRRPGGWQATRCTRARHPPTSRTWSAPRACSRTVSASIRSSPPTTRIPPPRCSRSPAPPKVSSSSACTAWAKNCTRSSWNSAACRCRCASTRRSGCIASCSPTWCAGCSRTAPTAPSCTTSPTLRSPAPRWPRIRARSCAASATTPTAASRCPRRCSAPRAPTRAAWTCSTTRRCTASRPAWTPGARARRAWAARTARAASR